MPVVRARRSYRPWLGVLLVGAAIGIGIYVERAAVLRWVGSQLVHEDPLERSDLIVVLAGGTPVREIEAADLYLSGYAPQVALTVEREAPGTAILRARGVAVEDSISQRVRFLRELGVPSGAVVLLNGRLAASTKDESEIAWDWIRKRSIHSIIVVTSRFHSSRSSLMFRRAFRDSDVIIRVRAASHDDFIPENWWQDRITLRNGVLEWQKVIFYRLWY